MDKLQNIYSDTLFSITTVQIDRFDSLAGGALSRGIDNYLNKDYEGAIKEFRRSIGLSPYSSTSLKAYEFMAQTYIRLDRPADAESAYKQAIRLLPSNDSMHLKLANFYFDQNRFVEAEKEYIEAVRINPSEENIYSLGQIYLSTNRLNEAETQFYRVLNMNSNNYGAIYSLGKIERQRGNFELAISRFKQVIDIRKDFAFAYSDLGMTYADNGDFDSAELQARILDGIDTKLAIDLRDYIYRVRKPRIFFATTFAKPSLKDGPGTQISSWEIALQNPNGSADFTLTVYFDKPMNRASVENLANWKISRAYGLPAGGDYNWGLPVADTEIPLPSLPKNILYDADTMSAKVMFTITQNANADGTIDPSHIVFSFSGKDAYGNIMDISKDQYIGLSIIV